MPWTFQLDHLDFKVLLSDMLYNSSIAKRRKRPVIDASAFFSS